MTKWKIGDRIGALEKKEGAGMSSESYPFVLDTVRKVKLLGGIITLPVLLVLWLKIKKGKVSVDTDTSSKSSPCMFDAAWKIKLFGGIITILVLLFLLLGSEKGLVSTDIEALYNTSGPQVVYFGGETCGSCREAEQHVSEAERNNKTFIRYFDTDTHRDDPRFQQVMEDFRVTEVPYIVKIQDGEYVDGLSLVDQDGKIAVEALNEFLLA